MRNVPKTILTDMSKSTFCVWGINHTSAMSKAVSKLPSWEKLLFSAETFGRGTLYAEYHDLGKNSHKFYSVEMVGSDVVVRWGRIGTNGTTQKVAKEVAKTRWESKLKKGYKTLPSKYTGTPLENTEKLEYCPMSSLFQVYVRGLDTPICKIPTASAVELYLSFHT